MGFFSKLADVIAGTYDISTKVYDDLNHGKAYEEGFYHGKNGYPHAIKKEFARNTIEKDLPRITKSYNDGYNDGISSRKLI